jgi:hypothetical protein
VMVMRLLSSRPLSCASFFCRSRARCSYTSLFSSLFLCFDDDDDDDDVLGSDDEFFRV